MDMLRVTYLYIYIHTHTHTHVHVHDSKQDPFEAFLLSPQDRWLLGTGIPGISGVSASKKGFGCVG